MESCGVRSTLSKMNPDDYKHILHSTDKQFNVNKIYNEHKSAKGIIVKPLKITKELTTYFFKR